MASVMAQKPQNIQESFALNAAFDAATAQPPEKLSLWQRAAQKIKTIYQEFKLANIKPSVSDVLVVAGLICLHHWFQPTQKISNREIQEKFQAIAYNIQEMQKDVLALTETGLEQQKQLLALKAAGLEQLKIIKSIVLKI